MTLQECYAEMNADYKGTIGRLCNERLVEKFALAFLEDGSFSSLRKAMEEENYKEAFRRLEQSGCIRTYWGDETTGARRRYYAITEEGRKAYQSYKQEWEETKEIIDKLLK